ELVAAAFLEDRANGWAVRWKDGNRGNPAASNLHYVSVEEEKQARRAITRTRDAANVRRWRAAHREQVNERKRARRAANPERENQYLRDWRSRTYGTNGDAVRARNRAQYARHREQRLARKREYGAQPHVRVARWAVMQRRRNVPPTDAALQFASTLLADPCSY